MWQHVLARWMAMVHHPKAACQSQGVRPCHACDCSGVRDEF